MATDPCADTCLPQIDQIQIMEVYDLLNTSIRSDLQADYDCKKINGATYADTWAKMMSPAIGHIMSSMTAILNKETPDDRLVKQAQASKIDADTAKVQYETSAVLPAAVAVSVRQEQGFDDNLRQKLFEIQMNSWAMMFSSGLLEYEPQVIKDHEATALYAEILATLGEVPVDSLGYFTQAVTASQVVAGNTTVSWGTVLNATTYTLYASTPEGSLAGFPKVVLGGASEVIPVTAPLDTTIKYTFQVIASNGTQMRNSSTTLSYTGV